MFGAGKESHHVHSPLRSVLSQTHATFQLPDKTPVSKAENHPETSTGTMSRMSRVSIVEPKQSKTSLVVSRVSRSSVANSRLSRASAADAGLSRFSVADPRQSRASIAPRRSTVSHGRSSAVQHRTSKMRPSSGFVTEEERNPPNLEEFTDFKALTDYFMGFWKAPHAVAALTHLEKLETKRAVRALQKQHGFWYPPPEVAEALKKNAKPAPISNLPDTKDGRNLKFVLKILGCSLHENKPYKQFLKAKTLRQKRYWLYKYQGPSRNKNPTYVEPVCPTRLKRLYQFFPDRFTEKDGFMYFNNKMISYEETKNVFYIGKDIEND